MNRTPTEAEVEAARQALERMRWNRLKDMMDNPKSKVGLQKTKPCEEDARAALTAAEAVRTEGGMEEFLQTAQAIERGDHTYRIVETCEGFEPQQLYTLGMVKKTCWFPLDANGFWAEPDAFSYGEVKHKHPLETKELAERAILCARRINGENLIQSAVAALAAGPGSVEAQGKHVGPHFQMLGELRAPDDQRVGWQDNADLMRAAADHIEDAWDSYDGAMSDLDSAVAVLIRRINGEADLASAAEWVRLNYPKHASSLNAAPAGEVE